MFSQVYISDALKGRQVSEMVTDGPQMNKEGLRHQPV